MTIHMMRCFSCIFVPAHRAVFKTPYAKRISEKMYIFTDSFYLIFEKYTFHRYTFPIFYNTAVRISTSACLISSSIPVVPSSPIASASDLPQVRS